MRFPSVYHSVSKLTSIDCAVAATQSGVLAVASSFPSIDHFSISPGGMIATIRTSHSDGLGGKEPPFTYDMSYSRFLYVRLNLTYLSTNLIRSVSLGLAALVSDADCGPELPTHPAMTSSEQIVVSRNIWFWVSAREKESM